MLAGASQAHRHMQFIPGDEIWTLRNPDATHVSISYVVLLGFTALQILFECGYDYSCLVLSNNCNVLYCKNLWEHGVCAS